MYYTFKLKNGERLKVFHQDILGHPIDKTHGCISFWKGSGKNHKEYVRTVRLDEDGREFFTWNKEKVFMDEFYALTPEELIKKYQNNDPYLCGDDLCNTLEKYGIECLLLRIKVKPLTTFRFGDYVIGIETYSNLDSEDDYDWVTYKFIEEYNRMPKTGYKLKLVPANEELYDAYPKQDYYIDDLNSSLRMRKELFQLILAS